MAHLTFSSPFGSLTVFEADAALVALEWGAAPEGETTPLLQRVRDALQRYFDGEPLAEEWPLAPAGTPFQLRVWTRLRAIPYGTTVTYGALAMELDSAPRAVAGACARNRLPLLIPCHRVVAADGALGGFSGGDGIETKAALLRLEGVPLPALV